MGNYKELTEAENFIIELFNLNSAMFDSPRPFGNYQMLIDSVSTQKITATIKNLPGDNQILINSKISFDKVGKIFGINGYAWLSDNAEKSLSELLYLLGKQENNRTLINLEINTGY